MNAVRPAASPATFPAPPKRFGDRELIYLAEAIRSGNLFHTRPDGFVARATQKLCEITNAPYAAAMSSGSAAVHVAVGALEIEPGAEVVTTPITDMGSVIGILYQNAIPVFADVDPHTYNLTPASIAAAITPHTRAVLAVHLAGSPCRIDAIADLCREKKLALIEDCAQAWGATYQGRHVGTFGDIGCFSFNHTKHLSCGDGGMIVTRDARLAERSRNFSDKFYDRQGKGVRMHDLAPNYRMSELQAAVALAQLEKLSSVAEPRRELGDRLTRSLIRAAIPGVIPHGVLPDATCSYWFYMLRLDPARADASRDDVVAAFIRAGVNARDGYIPRPLYRERVFQEKRFFPNNCWPAEQVAGRAYDFKTTHTPIAAEVLATSIVLPLHEGLRPSDVDRYVQILSHAMAR